ncbi:MAG: phenylalanine--tRNA ligase subunit beta [Gammaproteobacteria bacterium]|nr:phenylalanine--tRNA ligase subunit beta [Gammaproteobacteria bacterium]
MKLSENWLRQWVNPELSTEALVEQLTMAGLEVDSVEAVAENLDKIVIAELVSLEKHPDADKLNLCKVNDGSGEPVQVICGAKNVKLGMKVVFAQVGAQLSGIKIKKAKLRGVESFGMICSASELGMAESSDGIIELPNDATIGQTVVEYFDLDDQIIDVDLTPNRGDCLSVLGVAREVAANNNLPLESIDLSPVAATINDVISVDIQQADYCSCYVGRVIKNVNAAAETPLWMQEALRRSGLRSISPVVDVTNYVMLELGQPMHGFDLDKIDTGIIVRLATQDEEVELLDGTEVKLRDDTLVIADHSGALAMAGIMGGQSSSVQDDTKNIFLEAAFFNPIKIAGKARSYGLHTDSSHRFERGVDPLLAEVAMQRATALLLDIIGGEAGPIIEKVESEFLPQNKAIELRHEQITKMLGIQTTCEQIELYLKNLEMTVKSTQTGWEVTAPSYRFDINIEADLIEEVGRLYGYNNIPGTTGAAHPNMDAFSETKVDAQFLKDCLVEKGYFEAITYSFVSPELQSILDPEQETLPLANPISSELSVMRTTLLAGLMNALNYNLKRQQPRVRLFESGLCFVPKADGLEQKRYFAGVACGDLNSETWEPAKSIDFYDIKGDVEALLATTGQSELFSYQRSDEKILHPGQSADIILAGRKVGYFGALHPEVLKKLDVSETVYCFHIEEDAVSQARLPEFYELSKFPSIRRDIALMVDSSIEVNKLITCVKLLNIKNLQDIFIFDVYTSKELENNLKSVALGLILQDFSRTLVDEDVEKIINKVLSSLKNEHNAVLRDA